MIKTSAGCSARVASGASMKIIGAIFGWLFSLAALVAAIALGFGVFATPIFIVPILACLAFFASTCPPISSRIGFSKSPLKLSGAIIGSIIVGITGLVYSFQDLSRKSSSADEAKFQRELDAIKDEIASLKKDYGVEVTLPSDEVLKPEIAKALQSNGDPFQCMGLMQDIVEIQSQSKLKVSDLAYLGYYEDKFGNEIKDPNKDGGKSIVRYATIPTADAANASVIWRGAFVAKYLKDANTIVEINNIKSFGSNTDIANRMANSQMRAGRSPLDDGSILLWPGIILNLQEGDKNCFAGVGLHLEVKN